MGPCPRLHTLMVCKADRSACGCLCVVRGVTCAPVGVQQSSVWRHHRQKYKNRGSGAPDTSS